MKVLKYTTLFKVIVAIIATFGYFNHPHITRQIDTMGASLMYAIKIKDGFELFDLLPTSLAIGDLIREVTPMEFPILNLITSPFFLLNFKFNFSLAHIFLILINLTLFLWGVKFLKKNQHNNKDWLLAWWLTPLYGVEMLYFTRFMPDGTAFLLAGLSFMKLWFNKNKFLSIFLGSLALLLKPPLAIVYAAFLLKKRSHWPRLFICLILIVVPAVLYYTLGMEYLKSLSAVPDYFAISIRNPITSLIGFLSHPKSLVNLLFKDIFYRYSIILIIVGVIANRKNDEKRNKEILKLFGVFLIQLILAASLIGHHIFIHSYYAIGTSFIVAWIMAITLKSHPKLKIICLVFIVITNLERSAYKLKPLGRNSLKKQCIEILDHLPELAREKKIRSTGSPTPTVGLCLQRITNSETADYGVYPKDDKKYKCDKIIYETQDLKVCSYI